MKTLTQIAREMGVSTAAVSYVFNDKWRENRIAPDLAQRIRQKIEQDRARPSMLARQLSTGKTQMVGVALADLTASYNLQLLAGIERVLAEEGYLALLGHTDHGERESSYLDAFVQREVEGVLLCPKTVCMKQWDRESGPPAVLVDDYLPGTELDYFVSDNAGGAALLVHHLAERGIKRCAYYGTNERTGSTLDRRQGFADAVAKLGLRDVGGQMGLRSLDQLAACLATPRRRPEGLFVSSFLYFADGFRLLEDRGIVVGRDLLLVGFDVPPKTVDAAPIPHAVQQAEVMGEQATRQLLVRIRGDRSGPKHVRLMPVLHHV